MVKIIKGDDITNLFSIKHEGSVDKIEVFFNSNLIKSYENPIFPLMVSLSQEETNKLDFSTLVYIIKYDTRGKTTYPGYVKIITQKAPTANKCTSSSEIIELIDCSGSGDTIELTTYWTPKLTSQDGSVLITETSEGYDLAAEGGSGGTSDHTKLINRDKENQHPLSAITGLETTITEIKTDLLNQRDIITSNTQKITNNENEINNIDGDIADINNDINEIDSKILLGIKDVSYNGTTGVFTFTKQNGSIITIDTPVERDIKSGYYDDNSNELVIVLQNDQEIRIPASGLIDVYEGSDNDNIQINISADNVITAVLKTSTISKSLLTTSLQTEINNKADTSSLATVATSGSYNDLSNTPTIPSIEGLATEKYVDDAVAPKENSLIETAIGSSVSYDFIDGYYYEITSPLAAMTITSAIGQGAIEFATTAEFDIVVGEGLLIDGADKLTCKADKIYTLIYSRGILFMSGGA